MTDRITKEQRSLNMSHIRDKDTSIEIKMRKAFFHSGFRYRKNVAKFPRKPDIVLKKYKAAVFVNGCFFHHHDNCRRTYIPKSNVDYWTNKFEKNRFNDLKSRSELEHMGYRVFTIWECEIEDDFEERIDKLKKEIFVEKENKMSGDFVTSYFSSY